MHGTVDAAGLATIAVAADPAARTADFSAIVRRLVLTTGLGSRPEAIRRSSETFPALSDSQSFCTRNFLVNALTVTEDIV